LTGVLRHRGVDVGGKGRLPMAALGALVNWRTVGALVGMLDGE